MYPYPSLADFGDALPTAIDAIQNHTCTPESHQALWVCQGFISSQTPAAPTPAPAQATKAGGAAQPAMSDVDLCNHLQQCCPQKGQQKAAAAANVPWREMLAKLLTVLTQLFPA